MHSLKKKDQLVYEQADPPLALTTSECNLETNNETMKQWNNEEAETLSDDAPPLFTVRQVHFLSTLVQLQL